MIDVTCYVHMLIGASKQYVLGTLCSHHLVCAMPTWSQFFSLDGTPWVATDDQAGFWEVHFWLLFKKQAQKLRHPFPPWLPGRHPFRRC